MFTGVFKDRSGKEIAAEQALAELLTSRELRGHALSRNCEIGPFQVAYLFPERSLIVELVAELAPGILTSGPSNARYEARLRFLNDMGYIVLGIAPQELLRQPQRVLARLRTALEA
jgi:very-short-patch-repair endonuclease